MISDTMYYILCAVLSVVVLVGIAMMSKVRTARLGNALSALAMLIGIVATLIRGDGTTPVIGQWALYPSLIVGALIGGALAVRVKMIQMPQLVALLNGVGGGASALVGLLSVSPIGTNGTLPAFSVFTAFLAIAIGMITLVGSLVAAGKLHRVLPQKPQVWTAHGIVTTLSPVAALIFCIVGTLCRDLPSSLFWMAFGTLILSSIFGLYFSIRVGGADMPITISLLNSLSGVAGSIAGMAIGDVLLVAVGGIVGASGLLLTQIMCRAMNRKLTSILFAKTSGKSASAGAQKGMATAQTAPAQNTVSLPGSTAQNGANTGGAQSAPQSAERTSLPAAAAVLSQAKEVIIVPGYGMALAQAQHLVKQLADTLRANGAHVRFAIHPVAGRMPGHMNVLLAEANVEYDELFEMDAINDDFAQADAVIVIGANDVLNPAAREAKDTPIYGMPVLNVDQAKHVIICNYDLKPGYAGVENPLYSSAQGVSLLIGDAKETVKSLMEAIRQGVQPAQAAAPAAQEQDPAEWLRGAKEVIIVPGYGMALAQAQHLVKQLADTLTDKGAHVRFAIHPVAGRMPGHMNVLLAEANVDYDELFEMDAINDDFAQADAVIVIGANDVLNPAAREAKDTPIYGMPVLNVDQAKHVIICNYDLKPGYAGVENPLYTRAQGVALLIGDAKETVTKLIASI